MHCFFEYFKSSLSSVMSSISSQKYRKYRRVSISYFVEGPFFSTRYCKETDIRYYLLKFDGFIVLYEQIATLAYFAHTRPW